MLAALSCDGPFDVIAIDVWTPGEANINAKKTKVLTSLCTMTGFASIDFIDKTTDEFIARHMFKAFIVPKLTAKTSHG